MGGFFDKGKPDRTDGCHSTHRTGHDIDINRPDSLMLAESAFRGSDELNHEILEYIAVKELYGIKAKEKNDEIHYRFIQRNQQ